MQEQNPKLSRLINTVKYIKEYAKKAIISNILSNLKKNEEDCKGEDGEVNIFFCYR